LKTVLLIYGLFLSTSLNAQVIADSTLADAINVSQHEHHKNEIGIANAPVFFA
jgi:hypothetical protein